MKPLAVPAHVTIVIPCLNEARTIAACVGAREALPQSGSRGEFRLPLSLMVA
jgi:hypothetical protein